MKDAAKNTTIAILVGLLIGQGLNAHAAGKEADKYKQLATVMQDEALKQHIQYESQNDKVLKQDSTIADLRQQLDESRSRERAARASRSRRLTVAPTHTPGDFSAEAHAWANTPFARKVAFCESGRDHSAVSHSGTYRGKWQMDADFWETYGGLKYASSPELATENEQDIVAYTGYRARGWQPWSCSRMV